MNDDRTGPRRVLAGGCFIGWFVKDASCYYRPVRAGPNQRLNCFILLLLCALSAASQTVDDVPADVSNPVQPVPVRSDGKFHLLYELHITNFRSPTLVLKRIEVFRDRDISRIANYQDQEVVGRLYRPGLPADSTEKQQIAGGMTAIVFLEINFETEKQIPTVLYHRLTFGVEGKEAVLNDFEVNVSPSRPMIIDPPLHGEGWVALSALSNTNSHRRTLVVVNGRARIAQRFATDWTRIGADGLAFRGDPSKNSSWSAYGAKVYAVANAIVSSIKDGIPENDPTSDKKAVPIDLKTVAGNYVILDLGHEQFALYAHLQPGSIRVRVGDRVRPGQVIALLGNSGQADAPHLHFHIMNGRSPVGGEGLPYVFRSFFLQGVLPSKQLLIDKGWRPSGPAKQVAFETPSENSVICFAPCK